MTKSCADSAFTKEVFGCTEAINSWVKTASAELSPDFHTVSALSGAERTTSASAQLERAARSCRAPDSDTRTRCGSITVSLSWSWSHQAQGRAYVSAAFAIHNTLGRTP